MLQRPYNEEEFQKREAIGVIRASRFVRQYANSHKPIKMETVCEIHREIFHDAWPDIGGKQMLIRSLTLLSLSYRL